MARPTYEFPDFDYDLPEIPGFVDSSWHNDICPSLTRDYYGNVTKTLILWCDYADPSKREEENTTRFALVRGEYGSHDQVTLCESNSLADILKAIASNDAPATNVYDYFLQQLGTAPAEPTLKDLPVDSNCGRDCVASIDRYAALIAAVDSHPMVVQPLIESAKAQVEVLWCG